MTDSIREIYSSKHIVSEMQCELTLPHSMDGWGFTIRNVEGKHMRRNQVFFTGFEPQRILVTRLEPGEIKRITGKPSEFQEQTDEALIDANVPRLQFKVAAKPPEAEVVPPYTYQLPTGEYTLEVFVNVRHASNPNATLTLETSPAKFQVNASESDGVNADETAKPSSNDAQATESTSLPWRAYGRVVDGEGEPLEGVTIRAATGVGTLLGGGTTKTDADGRYDLRFGLGLRFGPIDDDTPHPHTQVAQVTASLNGYFEQNFSRHGDGVGSLLPISDEDLAKWNVRQSQVVLPERPRKIDFIMLPAAKASGVLIDADDKPLADYSVSLTGDQLPPGSSVISQVRTDKDGRFEMTRIPTNAPYQFVIRKPRDQLKPPWHDSWASEPMNFLDPQDADLAVSIQTDRVKIGQLRVKEFRIRIDGPGVHEKRAIQSAIRQRPSAEDASAAGLSVESMSLHKHTMILSNQPPSHQLRIDVTDSIPEDR
ncbi:MAG: carboxypeptidase-like regulatory domain-containing protein [Pirellulaceae bacterium]